MLLDDSIKIYLLLVISVMEFVLWIIESILPFPDLFLEHARLQKRPDQKIVAKSFLEYSRILKYSDMKKKKEAIIHSASSIDTFYSMISCPKWVTLLAGNDK